MTLLEIILAPFLIPTKVDGLKVKTTPVQKRRQKQLFWGSILAGALLAIIVGFAG